MQILRAQLDGQQTCLREDKDLSSSSSSCFAFVFFVPFHLSSVGSVNLTGSGVNLILFFKKFIGLKLQPHSSNH